MRLERRTTANGRQAAARWAVAAALMMATTLLATGCQDESGDTTTGGPEGCFKLEDGQCVEESFHNPPLLEPDADGVYELDLKPTELEIDGKRQCGRAFNGLYPAPTLETAAASGGEQRHIRVDLRNRFTKSDYRSLGGDDDCMCMDTKTMTSCTPGHHPGDSCECMTPDGKMCHVFDFNVTNLHAHGSHVRPDYAAGGGCEEKDGLRCRACTGDPEGGPPECYYSDDVLARVNPGEGTQMRLDIDEDGEHHAGLNWYHPHIHGSTAIQVSSGATGAWIVRGPLDEIAGIKNARERIMVITTPPVGFGPLADGEPCDEDHLTFNDFKVLGTISELEANLINGIRNPRLIMPPGQIERWRMLHGSFLDELFVFLLHGGDSDCKTLDKSRPPVRLTQIGRDGLPLPKPPSGEDWPYAPDFIFLSPGYRVEALLDGGALEDGDTLCLVGSRIMQEDTSGATDEPVDPGVLPTPEALLAKANVADVMAIINVTKEAGPPTETQMPDLAEVAAESPSMMLQDGKVDALQRCEEVQAIDKLEDLDQFSALFMLFLETEPDNCGCPDHNINCKNFEYTDREKYPYDRVLTKGAVGHWRVKAGFDGHPFHIHINPYLVCPLPPAGSPDPNVAGRFFEPPFAHWRDTYLINLGRTLDMLTEYRAFTGAFVNHCHKLTHEDEGMMELIRICDPEVESCDTLCSGGPCTWHDCNPGDDGCLRALVATECFFDASKCPEAHLRCTECGPSESCPPGAHCRDEPDIDGELRCAPGCEAPADCALIDTCEAGACVPAPCPMPCPPGQACSHGVCE